MFLVVICKRELQFFNTKDYFVDVSDEMSFWKNTNLKSSRCMKNLGKRIKDLGVHFKVKNNFWKKRKDYAILSKDSQKAECRVVAEIMNFPQGCLAMYVGEEKRRFVIPTLYLSHPIFLMLLEKAREEYGFKQR